MTAKVDQFPAINSNPVLCVAKDGDVLYSNEVGELLLNDWGVRVGEKLPSHIDIFIQRVISLEGIEKIEVKMGKRVYFFVFQYLPEQECVNIYGFDISDRKKLEGKLWENETQEKANLGLADIIDTKAVQSLMNDFYRLAHIPMALLDLKGNILVSVGWQEICTRFHRVNPETFKYCLESDINLTADVAPGRYKLYKCKNNMRDVVTPIMVEGQHIGNIFSGQFLFDNEPLDYELFRSQARKYGFNEEEYITALEKVPRLSREAVDTSMAFFMTFANMISQLSYSNIKLSRSLAGRDAVVDALRESEKRERARSDELAVVLDAVPVSVYIAHDPQALQITGNRLSYEWLRIPAGTNFSKSAPEGERPEMFKLFKDGVEIPPEKMPSQLSATGIEINNCELDIVSSDGKIRHVLGNARPLCDEQGNPRGSVSAFIDITERKRAEEALRESEERFRALVTASSEVVYRVSPDWSEMRQLYGRGFLADTEIPSRAWLQEYVPPEDQPLVTAVVNEAIRTKSTYELEHRVRRANGSLGWIFSRAVPILDVNSEIVEWFGAASDITERKKVEEALRESEERLRLLGDNLPDSAVYQYIHEPDGSSRFLYFSTGIERLNGVKVQDVLRDPNTLYRQVPPDYLERVFEAEARSARKLSDFDMKVPMRLPDGQVKWMRLHSRPRLLPDGRTLWNGVQIDVTKQKQAEKYLKKVHDNLEKLVEERTAELEKAYISLKESEKGLAEAQRMSHIGNWEWDIVTGETHWSDELYRIVGLIPQQFAPSYNEFLKYVHPDDRDYLDSVLKKAVKGKTHSIEYRIVLANGEERAVHMQSEVIFDGKNNPIQIKGIIQDITERKEVEEALTNIETARKKEIHHRIKNNLQVISSLLDLQADKFDNPKVIEAFRESQNRVISMALIHEELYKGENTDTLDFSTYIRELAENLFQTYSLSSKNIHLNMDLEENTLFDMDVAVPLGIIVNELISNSLKHAFPGRDSGEIRIKLCREKNGMHKKEDDKVTSFILTVSDNGIGISDNLNIEDVDSLGMQLINTLVDQLDGELEVKRNNGTEFTIRFTVTEKNNQISHPSL
jgi:PAS domain S-box-containing protein